MDMFRHLGLTISVLRGLRGKSQAQVAREAGVGKSQLSKYENGKELPKLDSLGKILTVLNVTPLGFFYTQDFLDRRRKALDGGPTAGDLNILPHDLSILSLKTQKRIRNLMGNVFSLHEALLEERVGSSLQEEEETEVENSEKS
jgi:transcriptional regulator with XRE-family HTH domain